MSYSSTGCTGCGCVLCVPTTHTSVLVEEVLPLGVGTDTYSVAGIGIEADTQVVSSQGRPCESQLHGKTDVATGYSAVRGPTHVCTHT